MLYSLLKGVFIGLFTGMPLGAVGALCLRTTLTYGPIHGLVAGIGSSIADSILGIVAILGISFIINLLSEFTTPIHLAGGIIIMLVGIKIFYSKNIAKPEYTASKTLLGTFVSTFLLAIANPAAIFSFILVFTALNASGLSPARDNKTLLILGILMGNLLWWIILITTAGTLHKKIDNKRLQAINKLLGILITSLGVVTILNSLFHHNRHSIEIPSKLFKFLTRLIYI